MFPATHGRQNLGSLIVAYILVPRPGLSQMSGMVDTATRNEGVLTHNNDPDFNPAFGQGKTGI